MVYSQRLSHQELRMLARTKIILHYSNPCGVTPICNNCGERDLEVLCIDHIEGGGRKQLRETHSKGGSFYRWLINQNFPEGYQILCANCNMKKGRSEQVSARKPSARYNWQTGTN